MPSHYICVALQTDRSDFGPLARRVSQKWNERKQMILNLTSDDANWYTCAHGVRGADDYSVLFAVVRLQHQLAVFILLTPTTAREGLALELCAWKQRSQEARKEKTYILVITTSSSIYARSPESASSRKP